ncbi:MAG: tyrosine--tRNA ligase, partial [Cetobacterium sp.]
WSNMIAGVDLIRKKERKSAFAMTCTLLTNSEGNKMGKTAKGALWLDPEKTSPYEFYQYWRNLPDADVERPLALLTYLPMDEVRRLSSLEGAAINEAKKVLAYEVTKIVHGEEEAKKAAAAAEALFGGAGDMTNVPTSEISKDKLGMGIVDLLCELELIKTKSEGRRLVQQGGLSIDNKKVEDFAMAVTEDLFQDGVILVKQGKKKYNRIVLK